MFIVLATDTNGNAAASVLKIEDPTILPPTTETQPGHHSHTHTHTHTRYTVSSFMNGRLHKHCVHVITYLQVNMCQYLSM